MIQCDPVNDAIEGPAHFRDPGFAVALDGREYRRLLRNARRYSHLSGTAATTRLRAIRRRLPVVAQSSKDASGRGQPESETQSGWAETRDCGRGRAPEKVGPQIAVAPGLKCSGHMPAAVARSPIGDARGGMNSPVFM